MKILNLTPADNLEKVINSLTEPAEIRLSAGIYRQKTQITADNIKIVGSGCETTVLTYGDYARKIHADGKEYNTFRTYTLCITGNGVEISNLTCENSNTAPEEVGQCVALSVHSKNFKAENVTLRSTQDTLFLSPFPDDLVVRYRDFIPQNQLYAEGWGVHLFENCKICGTVDFIFGCAEAYFKDCEIISLNDKRGTGFVAAPAHALSQERGFVFYNCNFIDGGAGRETCYLARPWRDFGKSEFIDCKIASHIKPCLFDKWNDTDRDKTARFNYYGLSCDFKPRPVKWAGELTGERADYIINICNSKFKK